MSRDLYASWSGAQAAWEQLELIAGNIANSSTAGYREQRASFELAGAAGPLGGASTKLRSVAYSPVDGEMFYDNVQTHLALRGEGFFSLADGTFTRDGGFRLDTDRRLVSAGGTPVLTDSGPIQLAAGETLSVDSEGVVSGSLSGELGRLTIVRLANGRPVGANAWSGTATAVPRASVIQGAIEGSNVDPLRGMVELVEASRHFESQQKAMQTSDEMRGRLSRMTE